jgi:ribonucleoside-diphosphate reductase beta chain
MTSPTPEVERVESASLAELSDVHIDDVYKQMDWLLKQRATPMELYYRWERQNWSTQELDFSADATHWASMTGDFQGIRNELQHTLTLFFIGEQAVTDTLSPLVHAAPDEPARIFLSTQLVDEARHAVFFSRFFEDVVGITGGLHAALAALESQKVAGFRSIFDTDLVAATEAVRTDPKDYGKWVEGVTIYHLVVEGMLALTGQKFLLGIIREMGILPAFYTGFTAVARDESRHVNFGVRALMEAVVRDPTHQDRLQGVIDRLLESACRIVAAPDRKFGIRPADTPPNLRIDPHDVRDFSLNSLTKRLRVVGCSKEFCDDVTTRGRSYFEASWSEYEDIHGEEHPVRFYRMQASSV